MRKFQLFSEYCDRAIWGEDPIDAVTRAKSLPRPKRQQGEKPYGNRMIANLVETPDLEISRVIELIESPGYNRGDKKVVQVLVESPDKKITAIDMMEIKIGRPRIGDVDLPQLTVPQTLIDALTKKAGELGISVPDARREAYRQFCEKKD